MTEKQEPITYPPVGRCIYCGRSDTKLTKEHIVAEALGGKLILPKATCLECAKSTCRAETHCFHKTLRAPRARFKFPSKRPSPKTLKLKTIEAETTTVADVSIDDYPTALVLPTFNNPQLLIEALPNELSSTDRNLYGLWHSHHKSADSLQKLIQKIPQPTKAILAEGSWIWFARMFAKIGHAYAVAEFGIDAFEPMLTDLIRERTEDFNGLIGNDLDVPDPVAANAQLWLRDSNVRGDRLVIASIQIFCQVRTPIYHVVVGKFLDSE